MHSVAFLILGNSRPGCLKPLKSLRITPRPKASQQAPEDPPNFNLYPWGRLDYICNSKTNESVSVILGKLI